MPSFWPCAWALVVYPPLILSPPNSSGWGPSISFCLGLSLLFYSMSARKCLPPNEGIYDAFAERGERAAIDCRLTICREHACSKIRPSKKISTLLKFSCIASVSTPFRCLIFFLWASPCRVLSVWLCGFDSHVGGVPLPPCHPLPQEKGGKIKISEEPAQLSFPWHYWNFLLWLSCLLCALAMLFSSCQMLGSRWKRAVSLKWCLSLSRPQIPRIVNRNQILPLNLKRLDYFGAYMLPPNYNFFPFGSPDNKQSRKWFPFFVRNFEGTMCPHNLLEIVTFSKEWCAKPHF